jgi:hypothetical protein
MTVDPYDEELKGLVEEALDALPQDGHGEVHCKTETAKLAFEHVVGLCMQSRAEDIAFVFEGLASDCSTVIEAFDENPCLALSVWTLLQTFFKEVAVEYRNGFDTPKRRQTSPLNVPVTEPRTG